MATVQARVIKNVPWGAASEDGETIGFKLTFQDGTEETFACPLFLLPLLMGNLTQYANMAEAIRTRAPKRSEVPAAPYRATKVNRSGYSPDGAYVTVEFSTTSGFPLAVAMSPELGVRP
jgi:hypothetical protein